MYALHLNHFGSYRRHVLFLAESRSRAQHLLLTELTPAAELHSYG